VTPPPFFHGVAIKSANRIIFMAPTKLPARTKPGVLKTGNSAP
jgi:hypothetical protein